MTKSKGHAEFIGDFANTTKQLADLIVRRFVKPLTAVRSQVNS